MLEFGFEKGALDAGEIRRKIDQFAHRAESLSGDAESLAHDLLADLSRSAEALEAAQVLVSRLSERLAEIRAHHATTRERMEDGCLISDGAGVIMEANSAAHLLLGQEPGTLAGTVITAFADAAEESRVVHLMRAADTGEQSWQGIIQPTAGLPFEASLSVAAYTDAAGKALAYEWILRDLGTERAAEEQIRALSAEMERRVYQRTAELEVVSSLKDELLVREQTARASMTAAHQRQAFLSQAISLMTSSLDYTETLPRLARMAVPTFADWCVIDLVDDNGGIRRIAVEHYDPAREKWARLLCERYAPSFEDYDGSSEVLRTGKAALYDLSAIANMEMLAKDGEYAEILRELGIRSAASAPLVVRGQAIGVITLVMARPWRAHRLEDLSFLEELAARAAMAIDNARLYRAAQREIEIRRQTEAILEHNQKDIQQLNERLQRAMTETHHRVKNNLQIIAAMVDMRLMEGSDHLPVEEVRRLGRHIRTMAVVHDILTLEAKEEGQVYRVSCKAILEKLLPVLQQANEGYTIGFRIDEAVVTTRQGTSLGLVVNELVSNAFKHGASAVRVELTVDGAMARMEVCDDGPGFPEDFDPVTSCHTGLDLVENLSRWDLGGQTFYDNLPEGGARVRLEMPLDMLAVVNERIASEETPG